MHSESYRIIPDRHNFLSFLQTLELSPEQNACIRKIPLDYVEINERTNTWKISYGVETNPLEEQNLMAVAKKIAAACCVEEVSFINEKARDVYPPCEEDKPRDSVDVAFSLPEMPEMEIIPLPEEPPELLDENEEPMDAAAEMTFQSKAYQNALRALQQQGTPAQVISLDNFFKGAEFYPRLPDGTLDYENPDTLDLPLIKQCLRELSETGKTVLPIYDFSAEKRSAEVEPIDLQGGVCIVEGIHALNPELTGLVKGDDIYRIYAGLREEYCIDGRRVINTQDIRLCRRTLRDAAARDRSPEKTLAMWDRVLDGETRYIKGFKTTADFLLDTSFTYELGLISKLLGVVRRQFTLEGHNAELWDETARRFEHVAPLELELLPEDSMLREFYGGAADRRAQNADV